MKRTLLTTVDTEVNFGVMYDDKSLYSHRPPLIIGIPIDTGILRLQLDIELGDTGQIDIESTKLQNADDHVLESAFLKAYSTYLIGMTGTKEFGQLFENIFLTAFSQDIIGYSNGIHASLRTKHWLPNAPLHEVIVSNIELSDMYKCYIVFANINVYTAYISLIV
jgi:hypothetical protein